MSRAQETVVWASRIIEVSSEFSPLEYSAIQALHKPNVLPNGGDNPNAWRPKVDNKEEYIMVGFDKPIKAKQVAIAESENPGAVYKVLAYDADFNEYTLFEITPRTLPLASRLLNLFFDDTPYEIHALKVFIKGDLVPGYNAIDAIGLSASNIPINVLINLIPGIAQNVEAEALGENVNSTFIEHSPIISPDGKRLYFSRRYHPENVGGEADVEDIWVSELDESTGEWLPAKNLGPPLNTEGPNFISSITIVDGEEVLILGNRYGKKGRMYTGVSVSKRLADGTFAEPEALEVVNDYNYAPKVDYNLSANGEILVISAERDDTYGGRDLYVSFKEGKTWTEPRSLGADVNTASNDYSPFLGPDYRTLYYSTSGYSGYGGSDIYVSIRLDETWTKWSEPENLGSSLNSKQDDEYFSIPASGQHIYFSRGTIDENTDIFRFRAEDILLDKESELMASMGHLVPERKTYFAVIYGTVRDQETEQPLSAAVIVERLPDGFDMGSVKTTEDGKYRIRVAAGARYGLMAKRDGYLATDENFDFNKLNRDDSMQVDLYLTQIKMGAKIVLKNIFFDFDKSDLKTASYPELNRVLEYLKDGQIQKIAISGHTDSVGDDAYNQKLSERRAKAVMDYFLSRGIAPERLSAVGYGEAQPRVPNDTKENRATNRRVEFQIVE